SRGPGGRVRAQGADYAPSRGQLLRHLAQAPPREIPAARTRPVGDRLGHGRRELAAARGTRSGAAGRATTPQACLPGRRQDQPPAAPAPLAALIAGVAVVVGWGGGRGCVALAALPRRILSFARGEGGEGGGRQPRRIVVSARQRGGAPAELPMMMAANQRWRGLA